MGWLVTRYEHTAAVLRVGGHGELPSHTKCRRRDTVPAHVGVRKSANERLQSTGSHEAALKAFTTRRVEALRPRIQSIAQDLLRQVDGVREFDIIEVLAHPLPCQVICEMVGAPFASSPQLSDWTGEVRSVLAPTAGCQPGGDEFMAFMRAFVADRRKRAGDDLLSALIAAEDSGQKLTEDELVATVLLLFRAGHSTTRELVGSGLVALLRNRDQWMRLSEEESLVPMAVEQCLRYAPSIPLLGRRALTDTAVADVPIPAGEAVFVSIAAANRDP